ncbi:MAG TPA: L,D-transpeptidase family protein [Caulobacteraceae bacterium]|jgi:murein L,D-transpeptidase YcbB/YkuD|nr:L,D-transpeptidase family protein [Caulobacteraceae bacterium]
MRAFVFGTVLAVAVASAAIAAAPPAPALSMTLSAEQEALLRTTLERAPSHGLRPAASVPAGGEALLEAGVRYAQAVRAGRLQPLQFPPEWAQRPAPFDARSEFSRAVAENRLGTWLESLPPPSTFYAQLRQALARYRAIAADGGWDSVPSGKAPKPGAADPRAAALRARLAAEGDAVAEASESGFDEPLRQALARFQARHGLAATGELNARTVAELNVPAEARVAQIEANLERWRWAPRATPATRLEVNIAAQTLVYVRDGAVVATMRTVVGRPADRTPIFSDAVEAVVFNPPWNVPSTIAAKEILPKLKRDPGYLQRNRFVVQPGGGAVTQRLQQLPGPKSALGLVKFDLPNGFNVYLHDTPTKSAFALDERALSHGCIRLEKPLDLARLVLRGDPDWTADAIQAALDRGVTVRARLSRPVPVYVGYWTAFVGEDGAVNFRRDLYGWDAQLLRLIVTGA